MRARGGRAGPRPAQDVGGESRRDRRTGAQPGLLGEGSAWCSLAVYSLGQQGPFPVGALAPTLNLGCGNAPAVAGIYSTRTAAPEVGEPGKPAVPRDSLGPSTA